MVLINVVPVSVLVGLLPSDHHGSAKAVIEDSEHLEQERLKVPKMTFHETGNAISQEQSDEFAHLKQGIL